MGNRIGIIRLAGRIAIVEVRRSQRGVRADRTKMLFFAMFGLFVYVPAIAFGTAVAYIGALHLEQGNITSDGIETIGLVIVASVVMTWVGVGLVAAVRASTGVGDLDQPAFVLLGAELRTVLLGNILAEWLRFGIWLLPALTVIGLGASVSLQHPLPVITSVGVGFWLLSVAVPTGYVLGLTIRHSVTVYRPIARLRLPLLVVGAGVYVLAIVRGWFERAVSYALARLVESPLGWVGEVLWIGLPELSPNTPLLLAGLVVSGVGTIALVWIGERVAFHHWFADPPVPTRRQRTYPWRRLEAVLATAVRLPVRTICLTTIRRTRRAPVRALYVSYPMLAGLFVVAESIRIGYVPGVVVVAVCVYIMWGIGALFALNPLGDLAPVLPAVLSSDLRGRDVVGGYTLAGILVGIPITLVVVFGGWSLSPLGGRTIGVLAVAAVAGVFIASAMAVGVGATFPRFSSVRLTRGRRAVMPSKLSFTVFTTTVMVPATALSVLVLPGGETIVEGSAMILAQRAEIEPSAVKSQLRAVLGLVLLVAILAASFAWRYASRRIDRFALE